MRFAFFGSSRLSVIVLDELERLGFLPSSVVTTPDKPKGRGLATSANPVKEWARLRNIRVYDPAKLDSTFVEALKEDECDLFIVASYGKIIPAAVLALPAHKVLNIHPSLLPKYRGASPLPTAMLDDSKKTGITILRVDEEMDHGPIVAQKEISIVEWPTYEEFEKMMALEGARLLASIIPDWLAGKIAERAQDHSTATFTRKIKKEDGLLDLDATDQYSNFRRIQAYHEWPQAYFFAEHKGKKVRVKVTAASFKDGKLTIEKVVPEGAREMDYEDFKRGYGAKN